MAEPRLVSNKWEIIRVIGHGGMGSVYEVRHTTLEIRRALKTLHRHLADDPDIVKRFLREGRNEARLEHPNIVRVYDFDTDPEFGAYLTMEIVEGPDLKQLMQLGALTFAQVVRIGSEVAAALDYAHSAVPPIVHRDIKPANILISAKSGVAKVTDFGIAKELADRDTGVTGTQGFIGTIRYAAPEQVRNDVEIDARVDVYSLGVMLFEMYSGKIYLESEKPADIYRRTLVEPDWQPPMVYPAPPPEEFAEVVRWCLQRRREDRIPSARELVRCLRLCTEIHTDHVHIHPVPASGQPPAGITDLAAAPPAAEPLAETSLTAVTIVPLVVDDESTTVVGLRARIMRLRQELESEAENFAHLFAEAAETGMPMADLASPDTFTRELASLDEEVEAALEGRNREQLAHLFSRCERLREEFAGSTRELRRRLADTLDANLTQLRSAWQTLIDAGEAAVSPEAHASFEGLITNATNGVEAADWRAGREALQQAHALLEQTRSALAERAQGTVDELLQQATALVAELTHYAVADAPPAIDMTAIRDAVVADLAAGRAVAAIGRAQDAVEAARHALEQGRSEAQDLLARHRRAAEDRLESLDAERATRVASEDFRNATAAIESARNAEQQDQPVVAATHYREAAERLTRVQTLLTEQQAARRTAVAARVDELLHEAAQAPEGVTGDARMQAQALVRDAARADDAAAAEALETARQLLETTLAEVPDYRAAQAAGESLRTVEQRVQGLAPEPQQLEAITAQRIRADAALAERRWGDAATGYRDAEHAWEELERGLQAERSAAQLAADAAAALAATLEGFDADGAQSVAADELAAARKLEADARTLQQQHEWTAASAGFEAAREAFARLQERVQQELGSQLRASTDELRRQLDAAADLPAIVAGAARDAATAALATAQSAKPSVSIPAIRAALATLDQARTAAVVYQEAAARRTQAETLYARVAQLGLGRRQLAQLQDLAKDATTAFDRRDWTRARDAYAQLHEQLDSSERRAAQNQRLAAARNAAEEARAALDLPVARECAANALRDAEQAFGAAANAEQSDQSEQAARHYEQARLLYARVEELVAAEHVRRLDAAGGELKQLLDACADAPSEVVGAARQRAEAVLAGPRPADFAPALSALRDAHAELTQALSEMPAFDNACTRRRAAEAAFENLRQQPAARSRIATAERDMEAASTAFAQRRWAQAADLFHGTHEQLLALERVLQTEAQRARAADARATVDATRTALDVETAGRCAAVALREAEESYSRGTEADTKGDFDAAVTAFDAARVAFAAVGEAVSREHTRLLNESRARLQQIVDNSTAVPDEVVGDERKRAQAFFTDPEVRDPRAALIGMDEARAALEHALSEVPVFTAAREQQQRAAEAQTRVAALRPQPRRKGLKAAQALLKDGSGAAQRREWAAMRDTYAKAADAFAALEQAPRAARPSIWPRLAAVAGALVVVIAAAVWQFTGTQPNVPKPQPTAARLQPTPKVEAQPQPPARQAPAPQAPAPQPFRIASSEPTSATLSGAENTSLPFSISPAGGAEGAHPTVQWLLDGTPVKSDTTTWTYSPNYESAGNHTVVAKIDRGEGPDQVRSWNVRIDDVDRAPVVKSVAPDNKKSIEKKIGDSVVLSADATDEDHDPLTYDWTIDGKPAGKNEPRLNLQVTANHTVGLTVTDGKKGQAQTSWQIAAIVSPLPLVPVPKQLEQLRFGNTQEFKLTAPADLSLADVTFTWTLDGRKVGDGPTFSLQPRDSLVRGNPVKIAATAVDKQGRSFSHDWKVSVLPPPPQIESATPSADKPIDAESGQSLAFQVAAAPTVGNQQLTYLYSVDAQKAERSPKRQFEFRIPDENDHRVTASVEDNYRQASQTVTWRVVGSDILAQARKWVATFQEARRNCDADKEGQLRGLSPSEISRLKDACSKQSNLQVSFTTPQVDKLTGNSARATFTMTQTFDSPSEQHISGRLACEFTLTHTDGQLRAERRAQGPCLPVQ